MSCYLEEFIELSNDEFTPTRYDTLIAATRRINPLRRGRTVTIIVIASLMRQAARQFSMYIEVGLPTVPHTAERLIFLDDFLAHWC